MFSSHTLKLLLIVVVVVHASRRTGRKPGRRPRKLQDFNGSNDAQNQPLKLQDSEVSCSAHSFINRDIIAKGTYNLRGNIDGCGKTWWDLWQLVANELSGAALLNNLHVSLSFQDDFLQIHKDEIESTIHFPLIYSESPQDRQHTQTKDTAEGTFGACVVTVNYDFRFVEFLFKTECYTVFNYHVWLKSIAEILKSSKRPISFKLKAEVLYTSEGVARLL